MQIVVIEELPPNPDTGRQHPHSVLGRGLLKNFPRDPKAEVIKPPCKGHDVWGPLTLIRPTPGGASQLIPLDPLEDLEIQQGDLLLSRNQGAPTASVATERGRMHTP